jgi:hypothetical protein
MNQASESSRFVTKNYTSSQNIRIFLFVINQTILSSTELIEKSINIYKIKVSCEIYNIMVNGSSNADLIS